MSNGVDDTNAAVVAVAVTAAADADADARDDRDHDYYYDEDDYKAVPTMTRSFLLFAVLPLLPIFLTNAYDRHRMWSTEWSSSSNDVPAPFDASEQNDVVVEEANRPRTKPKPKTKQNQKKSKKKEPLDPAESERERKARERIEAVVAQRRAVFEDSFSPRAALALAAALSERDAVVRDGDRYLAERLALCERAAAAATDDRDVVDAAVASAEALLRARRPADASRASDAALVLDPARALPLRARAFAAAGDARGAAGAWRDAVLSEAEDASEALVALADALSSSSSSLSDADWKAVRRDLVDRRLPKLEATYEDVEFETDDRRAVATRRSTARRLHRAHRFLFAWDDAFGDDDDDSALGRLIVANEYRDASSAVPFDAAAERRRVETARTVFTRSFFPADVGVDDRTMIFVIGFDVGDRDVDDDGADRLVRLLTDGRPDVVESSSSEQDSIFNRRLEHVRDVLVRASTSQNPSAVIDAMETLAEGVATAVRRRWERTRVNLPKEHRNSKTPKRFVDRALVNHRHVGFAHMLFPRATILHVVQEPTARLFASWSGVEREGQRGGLGATVVADPSALVSSYLDYRDTMDHWDEVLPGRITHVRYEDLVNDDDGDVYARVFAAVGLSPRSRRDDDDHDTDDGSAIGNRRSSSSSAARWKRYERRLRRILTSRLGDRARYDKKTNLPPAPGSGSGGGTRSGHARD